MTPISLNATLHSQKRNSHLNESREIEHAERVSEVDLVQALLKFRRWIERESAEQLQLLEQIHHRIVVVTERALKALISRDRELIPVPVRVVKQRQSAQIRSHD